MAALTAVSIIVPGLLINKLLEQSYDAKLVWILAAVLLTPFLQVLVSLMFERIITKLNQTINIEISNDYFRRISANGIDHFAEIMRRNVTVTTRSGNQCICNARGKNRRFFSFNCIWI